MDNIVVQYLPNAFAFIYVINSPMAGGVQKDRVSVTLVHNMKNINCPRRDFTQKAKSRGGTLVTSAYIKESTYS